MFGESVWTPRGPVQLALARGPKSLQRSVASLCQPGVPPALPVPSARRGPALLWRPGGVVMDLFIGLRSHIFDRVSGRRTRAPLIGRTPGGVASRPETPPPIRLTSYPPTHDQDGTLRLPTHTGRDTDDFPPTQDGTLTTSHITLLNEQKNYRIAVNSPTLKTVSTA